VNILNNSMCQGCADEIQRSVVLVSGEERAKNPSKSDFFTWPTGNSQPAQGLLTRLFKAPSEADGGKGFRHPPLHVPIPFLSFVTTAGIRGLNPCMFKPADLFDLGQTAHPAVFDGCEYAWQALKNIRDYIEANVKPELRNRCDGVAYVGERVFIGEGTVVEDGAMIKGPAIIGRNCEIRHNAYIRENVIIGDNCVVGNACELKNSFLFNHAVAPHLNYVGDSILGFKAHLGAGVKISNYKLTPGNIMVEIDGKPFDTGLHKFGALLGDHTEIGCNAVLNPGSIIGRGSVIYPNTNWRGVLPANAIVKHKPTHEVVERRVQDS
jgi:UDP-N-acetylglucosamine diphosphorylase / glucose-1-phosphate thymidylyltransferase / UDP-N-acetylgalactosamine diphosphorylase / glucosamine-1-phosphate N-acetyltransferase / galactosamine-1-phosphate N-acetyltransferase